MNNEAITKSMKSRNKRKQKQLIKKSQELVKQSKLKSNSQSQLESSSQSDFKSNSSLENTSNESEATNDRFSEPVEEEMIYFYVDPTTGEIQTISMEQDKLLRSEKLKLRYLKEYGISEQAFSLTQQFFDEFKNDYYLCTSFLRRIMTEAIKRRTDILATEEDINRVLNMLDTDCDGRINQGEFFQLLILFLSSKSNLKERVNGVLTEQSYSHEIEGYLTVEEARAFGNYLYIFFGINKGNDDLDFISNLYHISSSDYTIQPYKIDYEEVTYNYFATEIYKHLSEFCFVR